MEDKTTPKLKPCPFCGNNAISFVPDADRNSVSCRLGHAPMRTIEGWNTRTDPARDALVETLKLIRQEASEATWLKQNAVARTIGKRIHAIADAVLQAAEEGRQ